MYSSPLPGFWLVVNIPVGRSSSHLCLALLPSWMAQGCPSLDNPFVGTRVHWTLVLNRLTHSDGYALRMIVPPESFIAHPHFRILMQYAG